MAAHRQHDVSASGLLLVRTLEPVAYATGKDFVGLRPCERISPEGETLIAGGVSHWNSVASQPKPGGRHMTAHWRPHYDKLLHQPGR